MRSISVIQQVIDKQWESKVIKMQWIEMESLIQDVLLNVHADKTLPEQGISLINEILAAFTRRGHTADFSTKGDNYKI
jgi:hypothetical protein